MNNSKNNKNITKQVIDLIIEIFDQSTNNNLIQQFDINSFKTYYNNIIDLNTELVNKLLNNQLSNNQSLKYKKLLLLIEITIYASYCSKISPGIQLSNSIYNILIRYLKDIQKKSLNIFNIVNNQKQTICNIIQNKNINKILEEPIYEQFILLLIHILCDSKRNNIDKYNLIKHQILQKIQKNNKNNKININNTISVLTNNNYQNNRIIYIDHICNYIDNVKLFEERKSPENKNNAIEAAKIVEGAIKTIGTTLISSNNAIEFIAYYTTLSAYYFTNEIFHTIVYNQTKNNNNEAAQEAIEAAEAAKNAAISSAKTAQIYVTKNIQTNSVVKAVNKAKYITNIAQLTIDSITNQFFLKSYILYAKTTALFAKALFNSNVEQEVKETFNLFRKEYHAAKNAYLASQHLSTIGNNRSSNGNVKNLTSVQLNNTVSTDPVGSGAGSASTNSVLPTPPPSGSALNPTSIPQNVMPPPPPPPQTSLGTPRPLSSSSTKDNLADLEKRFAKLLLILVGKNKESQLKALYQKIIANPSFTTMSFNDILSKSAVLGGAKRKSKSSKSKKKIQKE